MPDVLTLLCPYCQFILTPNGISGGKELLCPNCGKSLEDTDIGHDLKLVREASSFFKDFHKNKYLSLRIAAAVTLQNAAWLLGLRESDLFDIEQGIKSLADTKLTDTYVEQFYMQIILGGECSGKAFPYSPGEYEAGYYSEGRQVITHRAVVVSVVANRYAVGYVPLDLQDHSKGIHAQWWDSRGYSYPYNGFTTRLLRKVGNGAD